MERLEVPSLRRSPFTKNAEKFPRDLVCSVRRMQAQLDRLPNPEPDAASSASHDGTTSRRLRLQEYGQATRRVSRTIGHPTALQGLLQVPRTAKTELQFELDRAARWARRSNECGMGPKHSDTAELTQRCRPLERSPLWWLAYECQPWKGCTEWHRMSGFWLGPSWKSHPSSRTNGQQRVSEMGTGLSSGSCCCQHTPATSMLHESVHRSESFSFPMPPSPNLALFI